MTFKMTKNDEDLFDRMRLALQDYNVDILGFKSLQVVPSKEPSFWNIIDPPLSPERQDLGRTTAVERRPTSRLSFIVRYQLEVCVSHGILNEHNLTEGFVTKLEALKQTTARELLEFLATQKSRVYNPMSVFEMEVPSSTSSTNMPHYCALVRSVTVTPTTLRFNTPTVETSNRIIRQYPKHVDRFLRVRFTDESTEVSFQL